ncbi:MAG TPA: hypothetical protein VGA99_14680, partial [bacterium]
MIAMLKNLKIQSKLLLMPLVASIAFLLVLGMDLILEQQNNRLLLRLEQEYYPHHEIAQKLAESLIALQRNLQDAVASSDTDLLVETEHPYRVILAQLDH